MEPDRSGMRGVLVICNGGFEGMEYELNSEETLIGRNPTTDVTLLDENISREHTIILFDAESGVYTVEDLQSTNGTKVNGKRIRSVTLDDDDEIEIGHTRFRFLLKDASTSD
jgi:pSer/pThr/pTyr-binding forkhead associated (FHA) protein